MSLAGKAPRCVSVCVCMRALVQFLEESLCSLCTNAKETSWIHFCCPHIPQNLALVGSMSVFIPSHHQKANSSTVSPSYINKLWLAPESP